MAGAYAGTDLSAHEEGPGRSSPRGLASLVAGNQGLLPRIIMRRSRAPKAYRIGLESLLLRHRLGQASGHGDRDAASARGFECAGDEIEGEFFFHISRSTKPGAGSGDVSIISGRPPSRGERGRRGHCPFGGPSPREEERRHLGSTRRRALARSCLARGDLAPISCRHRSRVARCVRHHRPSSAREHPSHRGKSARSGGEVTTHTKARADALARTRASMIADL